MALKWEDELYETECTGLDVAVTRTGMVSLTATFKPVEIDGTMVSRAYVHNFTIYKNLALGIGDKLMVYKANKIIPKCIAVKDAVGEVEFQLNARYAMRRRKSASVRTAVPRHCIVPIRIVQQKM